MSEGKKEEFRRDTCIEKLKGLITRAEEINTGKADYKYYNRIREMVLFGSLVNTDKEKVHDIDILVMWENNKKLSNRFHDEHPGIFKNFIQDMFSEWFLAERYLRGGKKSFSIHSNVTEDPSIVDIAKSDRHIVLISDYEVVPDSMDMIT